MADIYEVYNRCGSCRHFRVLFTDRMNRTMGECQGRPTHPDVGAHEYGCPEYHMDRERIMPGSPIPEDADMSPRQRDAQRRVETTRALQRQSRHPTERVRMVREPDAPSPPKQTQIPLRIRAETDQEDDDLDGLTGETMHRNDLKALLAEVLDEALGLGDSAVHPRYAGGKVVIHPGNPELQAKEIDIDVLFKKIVSVREKLRVLEQKINGSDKLDSADKVQIQQYITACYGSMTSFNFLFHDREDWFVGESSR